MDIKKSILGAIEEFNKYRVPEIEARLISYQSVSLLIEFTGSFCETCGFYDYFDDFTILLEDDYGLKAEINEIKEIPKGAVVEYTITG